MSAELILVVDDEFALEAVKRLNPALVVLDVMLPKPDGFEQMRSYGRMVVK